MTSCFPPAVSGDLLALAAQPAIRRHLAMAQIVLSQF
jgi:hypothetical protein